MRNYLLKKIKNRIFYFSFLVTIFISNGLNSYSKNCNDSLVVIVRSVPLDTGLYFMNKIPIDSVGLLPVNIFVKSNDHICGYVTLRINNHKVDISDIYNSHFFTEILKINREIINDLVLSVDFNDGVCFERSLGDFSFNHIYVSIFPQSKKVTVLLTDNLVTEF